MQKIVSFNNVAIVYVKESANRINLFYMSKNDAINIMNSSNFIDKMGVFYIKTNYYIQKMSNLTYYQKTET